MQRRDFLRYSALSAAAAAAGTTDIATAAERISSLGEEPEVKPLIGSAPMLQNLAETSIGRENTCKYLSLWALQRRLTERRSAPANMRDNLLHLYNN